MGHSVIEGNHKYLKTAIKERLSMGVNAICRYMDDLGFEAKGHRTGIGSGFDPKAKPIGIGLEAIQSAGWNSKGKETVWDTIICQAPLQEINEMINKRPSTGSIQPDKSLPFLHHVDKIGVASVQDIAHPNTIDFEKVLPGARSLVVLLSSMPRRAVELAGKQKAEDGRSYILMQFQLMRETLWAAHDLADWLDAKGHLSIPLVDLAERSYKTIGDQPDLRANAPFAAASGLGEIGLSGMLLSPEFGPRQRFSFVLTTAELEPTAPYSGVQLCRECGLCADNCVVQALDKDTKVECKVLKNLSYDVYKRQETRCRWARSLGMVGEAGPALVGWRTPKHPVPDSIDDREVPTFLMRKDPIQVRCYGKPNYWDIVIEKCLQSCPVAAASDK